MDCNPPLYDSAPVVRGRRLLHRMCHCFALWDVMSAEERVGAFTRLRLALKWRDLVDLMHVFVLGGVPRDAKGAGRIARKIFWLFECVYSRDVPWLVRELRVWRSKMDGGVF